MNTRYQDLVETIFRILFQDLLTRSLTYLTEKQSYCKNHSFKTSHKDIAADFGSSREVISRILKKLEIQGKIRQSKKGIFRIMKKNMGNTDRIIRTVVAIVIGVLYFNETITGTLGLVLMILAVVFALTSFVSFCRLYTLVGVSTYPIEEKK